MSVSLAAYVKGLSGVSGRTAICKAWSSIGIVSHAVSPDESSLWKRTLSCASVLGYVPKVEDCTIESRHLGLVLPEEIKGLKERLFRLSEILEKTLDIDGILALAEEAGELSASENCYKRRPHMDIKAPNLSG